MHNYLSGPMETVCYREVSATVRGYTCTLHYLYQRFRLINIYIVDRSVGGDTHYYSIMDTKMKSRTQG